MRAVRFHRFGGPEVLTLDDVPEFPLAPGAVRVEVHVAGVNFGDTEHRRGLSSAAAPLPDVVGMEGAGVVTALGEGVDPSWLRRRVAFVAPRACAEVCVVPVEQLLPLPGGVDFELGAAVAVQGLTAWHALHTVGRVATGEAVLVHSAAGGVGQLLVQLAREAGARVVGTVSREAKAAVARARGAHEVVVRRPGAVEELLAATGGRGFSLLLDGVGADVAADAPRCLAPLGRWVVYGAASGEPPPLPWTALAGKSLSVGVFSLRAAMPRATWEEGVREVMARVAEGRLQVELTAAPLADVARVQRRLEAGLTTGKWVLRVR